MIDLINKKFGRLIVLKRMGCDRRGNDRWLCLCDCGKETIVVGFNLKNGNTKSCGCLSREGNNTKHGHAKHGIVSRTYIVWNGMLARCTNSKHKYYKNYGGRGIQVCKRWRNSFENFLDDMGEPPTKKHSIDRIDNDGNYCKFNCRWATRKEQSRNTRRSRLITFNKKTQCLMDWAIEYKIDYTRLWRRIYQLNWSIEKALTTPVKKYKKRKK